MLYLCYVYKEEANGRRYTLKIDFKDPGLKYSANKQTKQKVGMK